MKPNWISLAVMAFAYLPVAEAGVYTVNVPAGEFSWVSVTDASGGEIYRGAGRDGEGTDVQDGKLTFTIPRDKEQQGAKIVYRRVGPDGKVSYPEQDFKAGGGTLAQLAPFNFPEFDAVTPAVVGLIPIIDMFAFQASGFTFTVGDMFTVSGGDITGLPWLEFKNGSSLPDDPDLFISDALLASLPDYDGIVTVSAINAVQEVPVSATWPLLLAGALALGATHGLRRAGCKEHAAIQPA